MKQTINYKRLLPDTKRGDAVQVTIIYSSFNPLEINDIEAMLSQKIGDGIIIEYEDEDEEL